MRRTQWQGFDEAGFHIDSKRSGLMRTRTFVESAKRLKKGMKYILKRIDEEVNNLG